MCFPSLGDKQNILEGTIVKSAEFKRNNKSLDPYGVGTLQIYKQQICSIRSVHDKKLPFLEAHRI